MSQTRLPRPKLPHRGQLLLSAVRSLSPQLRSAFFIEMAQDPELRRQMETTLGLTHPINTPRKRPYIGMLPDPFSFARGVANRTAERLAAASYPYVLQVSARLVAFSGWMANNYVKQTQMQRDTSHPLPPPQLER